MWRRKTVVFTTWSSRAPWVASWASRLAMAWRSSGPVPPAIWPSLSMPTWPDTTSHSPARTIGVSAPTGFGASLIRPKLAADGDAGRPLGRQALGDPGGGGHGGEHRVRGVDRRPGPVVAGPQPDLDGRRVDRPQDPEAADREVVHLAVVVDGQTLAGDPAQRHVGRAHAVGPEHDLVERVAGPHV